MKKSIRVALLGLVLFGSSAMAAEAAALHPGDTGAQVQQVQSQLRELGYSIDVDGSFGSGTESVVKAFQKDHGLEPDGVVGHATQEALFGRVLEEEEVSRGYGRGAASRILEIANSLQGVPYVWGGNSAGGFDCSGFVQYVFACAGVSLPRTCDYQFEVGQPVDKSELQPGDVVFFETYTEGPSHVGIYLSDGMFIHASSAEGYVCLDTLNRDYRIQTYIGARRMM